MKSRCFYYKGLLLLIIFCTVLMSANVTHADVEHLVSPGLLELNWSTPWSPDYVVGVPGFIDFEGLSDGEILGEVIDGVKFTTTEGQDWLVGTWSSNKYNGKYPFGGAYTSQGDTWAWLGPSQGVGIIQFTKGNATYFSCLTSTQSGIQVDAFDEYDELIASSGWATSNTGTGKMDRVTVKSPYRNIKYVKIYNTGNFWLIDCISTDAPGVALELNVPPFMQSNSNWEGEYIIDNVPGKTIGDIGCAITSVAMVLASYGFDSIDIGEPGEPNIQPLDPKNLNIWLKKEDGYLSDGSIIWNKIEGIRHPETGGNLRYIGPGDKNYAKVNTSLEKRLPVILHVRGIYNSNTAGHFVVARGKYTNDYDDESQNYFLIRDPDTQYESLDNLYYGNNWFGYRLYEPSDGIIRPAITIRMHSPAEMLISDSLGRKTGYDPASRNILEEIPGAFYYEEGPIINPQTEQVGVPSHKELYLPDAKDGHYQLTVFGTNTGNYKLDIESRDFSGQYSNIIFQGATTSGKIDNYVISNSTTSAKDLTVTSVDTIEATIKIHPETLQLGAKGRWITIYIQIDEFEFKDEDAQSIQLMYNNNSLYADSGEVLKDGRLVVKFDMKAVLDWFDQEGDFEKFEELIVKGEVEDVPFIGYDTIRVIYPQPRGKGR